jgi:chemotaxis signal transduction protein
MDAQEFLHFRLGFEQFALPIDVVERALAHEDVRLKLSPNGLRMLAYGRHVIPVVDGAERFDIQAEPAHALIITRTPAGLVGLQVTELLGVTALAPANRMAVETVFVGRVDQVVAGFYKTEKDDDLIVVVNPNFLLAQTTLEEFSKAA